MVAPFQLNQLDQVDGDTQVEGDTQVVQADQLGSLPPPEAEPASEPSPNGRGRHAATSTRKRRRWPRIVLALLLVVILAAAGGFVVARLRVPVAAATVTSTIAQI